jgi:hypothetical protein
MRSAFVRSSLLSFSFFTLAVAGCDCAATPAERCETSADCPDGQSCVDHACVARADAGRGDGGGGSDGGPMCVDVDHDGHYAIDPSCPAGDDCDDLSPTVHGGQPELCGDGIDNDCNEGIDEPSCGCDIGQTVTCYSGTVGTSGVGRCRPGIAV